MQSPYEVPQLSASGAAPSDADVDLLIIPISQDHTGEAIGAFDGVLGGDLASAFERGEFRAKPCELYVPRTPANGFRAARVVFVGGGNRAEIDAERIRRMAATATQAARHQHHGRVRLSRQGVAATGGQICLRRLVAQFRCAGRGVVRRLAAGFGRRKDMDVEAIGIGIAAKDRRLHCGLGPGR